MELEFRALTIIDQVTNYCEIIQINNKKAFHVATQLENAWLSRYPRPVQRHFDPGGEFIGKEFIQTLQSNQLLLQPKILSQMQSVKDYTLRWETSSGL